MKIRNRRLKIKKNNDNIVKESEDIITKIEKTFNKLLISLGLIVLLFTWSAIPVIFLQVLGITYQNFSQIGKYLYTFIMDILFIVFLVWIYRKDIKKDFKNFFNKSFFKNLKTAYTYWLVGLGVMFIANIIIFFITNGKISTNEEEVRSLIDTLRLYMTFQLIIYAPITEELIFRKSIKEAISNKYIYPLVSGLVFGFLHIITSLESPIGLLYLIPYSALGIAFALLYQKTDNIFSTIVVHATHNSLALLTYLINF